MIYEVMPPHLQWKRGMIDLGDENNRGKADELFDNRIFFF